MDHTYSRLLNEERGIIYRAQARPGKHSASPPPALFSTSRAPDPPTPGRRRRRASGGPPLVAGGARSSWRGILRRAMRSERWKRALRWTFLGLFLLGAVLGVWAFAVEPASLRVREYRLAIPGWPAGRSGMRIALLADLHVGSPYNGLDKLDEVVRRTNAARPDLVLIPGDLVIQDVLGGHFV